MQVAIEDANFELDSIVIEWMQLTKCEKSLKLFQDEVVIEMDEVQIEQDKKSCVLEKFKTYIREQENARKSHDDDLGFEVNFGAFRKESNIRLTSIFSHLNERLSFLYPTN